jgi:hypothetical protein
MSLAQPPFPFPVYVPMSPEDYDTLVVQIRPSLQEDENAGEVLSGASYLAARRAALLGRPYQADDIHFALAIWTFWPFKPPPPPNIEQQILRLRRVAFRDVAHTNLVAEPSRLQTAVPDETLRLSFDELYARQRRSLNAFLSP